jgi:hypothetical protein
MSDDGLETAECRDCRVPLNVHQPDEDRPDHLLGTCARCGAWYLIELGAEDGGAYLVDLTNVAVFHAALKQDAS